MSLRKFVALFLLGVVLQGCSLAARTFGRYYDDKVISGSVKHGFVAEQGRSLPSVSVDTYEGTVYLSGDVETSGQKAEAEAAAWRVEGLEQRPARGARDHRALARQPRRRRRAQIAGLPATFILVSMPSRPLVVIGALLLAVPAFAAGARPAADARPRVDKPAAEVRPRV